MILQGILAAIKAIPKYVHLAKIFSPKNTDYYSSVISLIDTLQYQSHFDASRLICLRNC